MTERTLEFKIGALLKNIIGKDLITDDYIAVFELVKNSYDAHAKNVIITFEEDKIIIADDGKGMSLKDLEEKWLFVAYSAKHDGSEDLELKNKDSYRDEIKVRKHYAGAKGIGRFSCDRLGERLTLRTRKVGEKETNKLNVNWNDFERDPKKEFQKIQIGYAVNNSSNNIFPNSSNNGTILEINKLSDTWNRKKILGLKHSLEKLINPFGNIGDFSIEIICKREQEKDINGVYTTNVTRAKEDELNLKGEPYLDRDRVNGIIRNSILDILNLKTTQIKVTIKKGDIISELEDRGTLIYKIKEKNDKYKLIEDLQIDLFFLNTAAKNNFTRKMGIQVVNFGSVFLFKNGFRVQPYGTVGDDSWGLDYRAQQGYNRYLGSRDLFGRVSIITDNASEFKEVSSRDGGLVETKGYEQLLEVFREKAHKQLERYVAGVLWGEGFIRKNYFGEGSKGEEKADTYRKKLQSADKYAANIGVAKSNLGSKLDYIQIIKSLTNNKNVEIIEYNKELIDLVNENLEDVSNKVLLDIKYIAQKTEDEETQNKLLKLENRYKELLKIKEAAEKRARTATEKAKKAKEEAEKAKKAKEEAEKKAKEEEEKRKKAEKEKLKAENEKLKAQNQKLNAEKKAKEEEEKRKKAEKENRKRKQQVSRYKAAESVEYKDLRDSNHIIGVYSDSINKKILLFKRQLDKKGLPSLKEISSFIEGVSLVNSKIATVAAFTIKSNYLKAMLETEEDIVKYIVDYVNTSYKSLYKTKFEIITKDITFITKFKPIELCTALDNILNNSQKKNASKIIYEFSSPTNNTLILSIKDIGLPLSKEIQDSNLIFEEGITTTRGTGLGLAHVKKIITGELKGKVAYNPNYKEGFELIITLIK